MNLANMPVWPLEDPFTCDGFLGNGYTKSFELHDTVKCRMHPWTKQHFCIVGMTGVEERCWTVSTWLPVCAGVVFVSLGFCCHTRLTL